MRYQIEIRTSERTGAGTDARVYVSLAGDKYAMAEAEIDDPITANDWERGDVNSLFIDSVDLGDIVRGTLRHDGSGAFSDWAVESVKVRNDEDGRTWIASVSTTLTRNQPYHLVFLRSGSGDGLMSLGGIVGPPKARASRLEPGEEDFRTRSVARSQQRSSPKPSMAPLLRTTNVSLSEPLQSVMTEPTQTVFEPPVPQTQQIVRTPLPAPRLQRTPTRPTRPQTPTRPQQSRRGAPQQIPSQPMVREPSYSDEQGNLMPESELDALRAQGYTDDQILAMSAGAGSVGNPMPERELDALRAQGYTDEQILAMTSPAEGQTLASAEGRRLPEREGQISVSDEGVSGNSYEGFSATSDPGVRIADAEPQTNESDEGNATEGLSPGDAPDESDTGLVLA